MTIHWTWGLSTALLLTYAMWLNGRIVRAGWLVALLLQVVNMAYGLAYGQITFLFLLLPSGMCVWNWWKMRPKPAPPPPPRLLLPLLSEEDRKAMAAQLARSLEGFQKGVREAYGPRNRDPRGKS